MGFLDVCGVREPVKWEKVTGFEFECGFDRVGMFGVDQSCFDLFVEFSDFCQGWFEEGCDGDVFLQFLRAYSG